MLTFQLMYCSSFSNTHMTLSQQANDMDMEYFTKVHKAMDQLPKPVPSIIFCLSNYWTDLCSLQRWAHCLWGCHIESSKRREMATHWCLPNSKWSKLQSNKSSQTLPDHSRLSQVKKKKFWSLERLQQKVDCICFFHHIQDFLLERKIKRLSSLNSCFSLLFSIGRFSNMFLQSGPFYLHHGLENF